MPAPTTAMHFSLSYIMPGASVPMQPFALTLHYEFAALLAEERTGCRLIPLGTPCFCVTALCKRFPTPPNPTQRHGKASQPFRLQEEKPSSGAKSQRAFKEREPRRHGGVAWETGWVLGGTWATTAAFMLQHPKSWESSCKNIPHVPQPWNGSFRIHRNSEPLRGIRAHQIVNAKIIVRITNT